MSTASDVARVFTDTEEGTYSIFSKPEQAMLARGQVNRSIIEKILDMKFYNYQHEAMFRFFEAFLCTLRGWGVTPDTTRQFRLLKRFASDTHYDYYMEDQALKEKQEAVEVTPSGHVFTGDNLIAF